MRFVLSLVFALAFCLPLQAEESSGFGFTFNHVALSVADVDRSADFYREVFGLAEIVNRTEIEGIRWFSLGEGKELHLISIEHEPVTLKKDVHFALTTPEFESFVAGLRNTGVAFGDFGGNIGEITIRADGARQIYLQDPDGYWIEVNSVAAD
jgi:catechol 2,3-dioxygenase-like lactoylglutathione lyase family enzyme